MRSRTKKTRSTVGYGRQKSKPKIQVDIKLLAHVLGVEIVDIDKTDKKNLLLLGVDYMVALI